MKVDIGIIGAMEPEVEALISKLSDATSETVSGIVFFAGKIGEKTVVIAKCGIGKVFAAMCCEIMIMKYSPALIINSGVGGALAEKLKTGDVVIADRLCQHDMDTSAIGDPKGLVSGINKIYFESDTEVVKKLCEISDSLGLNYLVGTVASGDKFIASKSDKDAILRDFSAVACEMEGAAIAQVCFVNETPFAVIRAISDSADGEATMDYPTFLPIAAANSASMTLELIKIFDLGIL